MVIIYLVGTQCADGSAPSKIFKSYPSALNHWNELRLDLIKQSERCLEYDKKQGWGTSDTQERIIKNLQCDDPEKMDNYPQDEPYIQSFELEE